MWSSNIKWNFIIYKDRMILIKFLFWWSVFIYLLGQRVLYIFWIYFTYNQVQVIICHFKAQELNNKSILTNKDIIINNKTIWSLVNFVAQNVQLYIFLTLKNFCMCHVTLNLPYRIWHLTDTMTTLAWWN